MGWFLVYDWPVDRGNDPFADGARHNTSLYFAKLGMALNTFHIVHCHE